LVYLENLPFSKTKLIFSSGIKVMFRIGLHLENNTFYKITDDKVFLGKTSFREGISFSRLGRMCTTATFIKWNGCWPITKMFWLRSKSNYTSRNSKTNSISHKLFNNIDYQLTYPYPRLFD
jgi:hypothetical protein